AAWSGVGTGSALAELQAQAAAINQSHAVMELDLQGNILACNNNFLRLLGYRGEEIQGKNQRLLLEPQYGSSEEYRPFWEALRRGEYQTGQRGLLGKGGREVSVQASYSPVLGADGKPFKVLVLASEVSGQAGSVQEMHSIVARTQGVVKAAVGGDLSRRVD